MQKKNKDMTVKEIEEKVKELKVGLLRQDAKRKGIRREIARLFTQLNEKQKEVKK